MMSLSGLDGTSVRRPYDQLAMRPACLLHRPLLLYSWTVPFVSEPQMDV